jgi:SAM-dependent methyltransferase
MASMSAPESDASNGWNAVADKLIAAREKSPIGAGVVRTWAQYFPKGASILDLGCGSGVPVSQTLIDCGLHIHGVDASPTLVAAFRSRFPNADIVCEPAESSRFFSRNFDGVIAVGLMFLLPPEVQRALILKTGAALNPGGRFLFSSPYQICAWSDLMTGRESRSLGKSAYATILSEAGLALVGNYTDEGESHYYHARKP